jgi:energy-converting hydrogenase Eha subunit E
MAHLAKALWQRLLVALVVAGAATARQGRRELLVKVMRAEVITVGQVVLAVVVRHRLVLTRLAPVVTAVTVQHPQFLVRL